MQFSETLTEKHVCGHLGTTRSSSAATTVGHPRTSSWSAGIPARIALPITPHHKTCHAKPVDRSRRVQSLTRLHLVKPCRRGRRRSQGGLILVRGHPCPHRFAHHAPSQDVSRQACRPRQTCAKSHPTASCGTLPARAPALPGGPHPGPRASLPASLSTLRRGIRQRRLGIQAIHEVIYKTLEHLIFNIHLVYRDVFLQERFHRPA